MWIEVIGLPGVGKTTLIKKGLPTISGHYQIVQSNSPSFFQKIIHRILFFGFYGSRLKDIALANKLAYRHSFRLFKSQNEPVFFYDSGLLQVFIENLVETDFECVEQKLQLWNKLPRPDKIIFLTDDVEAVVQREVGREKRRFQLDVPNMLERYRKAQLFIEQYLLDDMSVTIDLADPEYVTNFLQVFSNEKVF